MQVAEIRIVGKNNQNAEGLIVTRCRRFSLAGAEEKVVVSAN